jgi:hypothetical protein
MNVPNVRQLLEHWIEEINKEMTWSTTVSTEGMCSFQGPDGHLVNVEAPADFDLLIFHAVVGELADPQDHRLLRALLACNWFGKATGPGTLGLEPGGRRLVLAMPWLDASTGDLEQFLSLLVRFTEIANRLRERIAQGTVTDLLPDETGEAQVPGAEAGWQPSQYSPFLIRG